MKRILRGTLWCPERLLLAALFLVSLPFVSVAAEANESASAASLSVSNPPPAPRRPSIILIVADHLGYGDLGCYGQSKIKTPNLDRLAAEGMRFTSYYAGGATDEAARVALLTGMFPDRNRTNTHQSMSAEAVTLAEFLQKQGYHTGLIGLWGLGDLGAHRPQNQGFDEFAGFLSHAHARDYYTERWWRYDSRVNYDDMGLIADNFGNKRGQFMPDKMSGAAVAFVVNNAPHAINRYRPFFLLLSYPIPHDTPIEDNTPYANESWSEAQQARAAMITRMDAGIGQMIKKLDSLGLSGNTVIFFTSVNGPQKEGGMDPKFFNSTGPFRGLHGTLHEGALRLPMIARWPGRIKQGAVTDLPCMASDILPTAAEIALTKAPKETDGISVLPTLMGLQQTNRHETLYWELEKDGRQQALREGDWKALRVSETNQVELYNLEDDPAEQRNAARTNPELVTRLERLLEERGKPATK